MTRTVLALLCLSLSTIGQALPTNELLHEITKHVVKVQVALNNGAIGYGSGVVVAKDQVVTNCHVIADARGISVSRNGEFYIASAIKADWKHDVCIIKVNDLDIPEVNIGSSKNLQYEQPVFAVGYPNFTVSPVSTFGFVKGLYPMDDSVILRTTSAFRLGASGGGVFDDTGNLVGIIALKSPGRSPYYYNMAVEWVQALIEQPEQAIDTKSELAFWAEAPEKWPYFMKVVHPYLTQNWQELHKMASAWSEKEPETTEAWFYLAAAEYQTKDSKTAEQHLNKVVAMNAQHSQAIYYLGLIAEQNGQHDNAMTNVALLSTLDKEAADELKVAMGINVQATDNITDK